MFENRLVRIIIIIIIIIIMIIGRKWYTIIQVLFLQMSFSPCFQSLSDNLADVCIKLHKNARELLNIVKIIFSCSV
jgi:hypothetical protein